MNRYSDWLLTLVCWDGALPLAVVAAPAIVATLFPGRPGALELTFVVVPITAFLMRAWNGRKRLLMGEMYFWQALFFSAAIFVLVVLDAALIMSHMCGGMTVAGICAWLGTFFVYLLLMAVALFPARLEWERDPTVFRIEEGL